MDMLERHGFMVAIIFMFLSVVVAAMKNNNTIEVTVNGAEVIILPVHLGRKVCLPQVQLVAYPYGNYQKQQSSPRRLDQEALLHKTPPEASVSLKSKDTIVKAFRLTGGVLSLSILLLPFIGFWTSGSLQNAFMLYSETNLVCTALATYSWLAYSVLQVSFKDQQEVIGIDAIVVNGFSWGFIAFMLLAVLMSAWQEKGRFCLIGLCAHIIFTVGILQFPIFKWVHRGSNHKFIIGVAAAMFQNIAELIPIINLAIIWLANAPEGGYPLVPNYKKFTIVSRACDSLCTLYWMLYCAFTYEFDEFGISSIVCGVLSLISLCAHVAWAMKPN